MHDSFPLYCRYAEQKEVPFEVEEVKAEGDPSRQSIYAMDFGKLMLDPLRKDLDKAAARKRQSIVQQRGPTSTRPCPVLAPCGPHVTPS